MLGFGALGQLALGQQPLQSGVVFNPEGAGSGAAYWRFKFAPEPAFEVRPSKPFRPVWDRPRGGTLEKQASMPSAPDIPLPPPDIFEPAVPLASGGAAPFGLPDFNNLVPQNTAWIGQQMTDARDQTDVMDALGVLAELVRGPIRVN